MVTAQTATTPIIDDDIFEEVDKFEKRGDWTKERHEKPERSAEEVDADILRLQAERRARMGIEKEIDFSRKNMLIFI